MKKTILPNGMTVISQKTSGKSVVLEIMIKVGSNHETKEERGIAHFIEHILFEGTTKRPTNWQISNEIEKIGGEFNAYTTNERTSFYVKVLKKHFDIALDVLADIFQNSLFKEEHIEKEKNIVIKEIDMVNDEPRFYQWILLQKNLYKNNLCRFPTYGDKKVIKNLTREQVINFFKKYYVPNNMVFSVIGNVNPEKLIKEKFNMEKAVLSHLNIPQEPLQKSSKVIKERRKIASTYTVFGFKTVPRTNSDSYVLDVINGILGRGQSGKMFTEIRTKHALAYDVGSQHIAEFSFGYFAVYATIDKKNINKVTKLVLEEIKKLKKITTKELKESQAFIEGSYFLEIEDTQKISDHILFWEQIGDANLMKDFVKNIKKVTLNDVKRVIDNYFNYYTLAILEGK